jgi:hypothetical protein
MDKTGQLSALLALLCQGNNVGKMLSNSGKSRPRSELCGGKNLLPLLKIELIRL